MIQLEKRDRYILYLQSLMITCNQYRQISITSYNFNIKQKSNNLTRGTIISKYRSFQEKVSVFRVVIVNTLRYDTPTRARVHASYAIE